MILATPGRASRDTRRARLFWVAVGVVGFALAPWYAAHSVGLPSWLTVGFNEENAPAWLHAWSYGRDWLWPIAALFAVATRYVERPASRSAALGLAVVGATGLAYTFAQGFAIGPSGWSLDWIASALPALPSGQRGLGLGASLAIASFAMLFALGLAGRGGFKGDGFVAASVVGVTLLVALFTFYPVARILISAVQDRDGASRSPRSRAGCLPRSSGGSAASSGAVAAATFGTRCFLRCFARRGARPSVSPSR